ncbi:hypothetical protein [Bartonella vinsonii]|uniref:hypothetical protein n=1 Tax=Bartonella vinsonii TaxID=33047 RepID=UPI001ABAA6CC|nr:hypothetical protein [Bartonella vinsonii]
MPLAPLSDDLTLITNFIPPPKEVQFSSQTLCPSPTQLGKHPMRENGIVFTIIIHNKKRNRDTIHYIEY